MTKLLSRSTRAFAVYAIAMLALSIPAYTLVINHIWNDELDERNVSVSQKVIESLSDENLSYADRERIISEWNSLPMDVTVTRLEGTPSHLDSSYSVSKKDYADPEGDFDVFRAYITRTQIGDAYFEIRTETNVEELDETSLAIGTVTVVFTLLTLLGFLIINRNISKKAWNPFYKTIRELRNFKLSQHREVSWPETDIEEFAELNASLKDLIHANVETYRIQKSFTENASHELQTPLALVKAKIDLLQQESENTESRAELISDIQTHLSRLSRINKNLLLLAKVENHVFEKRSLIALHQTIENCVHQFSDYLEEGEFELTSDLQEVTINANAFALETVVNNLLSNAIRHSDPGTKIHISLNCSQLQISNSGEKALDASVLFDRFSTQSKKAVSSGLGLAIVKEICTSMEWTIEYAFEKNLHVFTIDF